MSLPTFTINEQGEKGMVRHRQCTGDYKITPVVQKIRELYGLKPRQRMLETELWLGITIDEAQRMKDNQNKKITNRFPFIEMMMNRGDCMNFMRENGFPIPRKSACVFCPYSSDRTWTDIKENNPNSNIN